MSEIDFGRYYPNEEDKNNCIDNLGMDLDEKEKNENEKKILFKAFDILLNEEELKKKRIKGVKSPSPKIRKIKK